ncbi:elongation factor Tu [Sulfitobacter indolifex HEL-45]|uniref:Elongation factor Tu n=1 Tax=Sulfitobacter indolifex HEL-45 TaxID=391624 RepID=A0ABM9X8V5_9RHOB|nr:elongation factor Tu [Sulfitobacter indolifex HEL-45]
MNAGRLIESRPFVFFGLWSAGAPTTKRKRPQQMLRPFESLTGQAQKPGQ